MVYAFRIWHRIWNLAVDWPGAIVIVSGNRRDSLELARRNSVAGGIRPILQFRLTNSTGARPQDHRLI
jgi:hypothetical protein